MNMLSLSDGAHDRSLLFYLHSIDFYVSDYLTAIS